MGTPSPLSPWRHADSSCADYRMDDQLLLLPERSLVPMGEERPPAEQQYGPHTSQTARLGVLLESLGFAT